MKRPALYLIAITIMLGLSVAVSATDEEPNNIMPVGGLNFADAIDVTVVNIEVYVRDKKGAPVVDLTADDFVILQDGVQMPVSNFASFTTDVFTAAEISEQPQPTPQPSPSVNTAKAPAVQPDIKPIWLVIYIDNENIHPMRRNRVLRRVREFVTENLRQPAKIMVVSYQRSLKVLQPFTDDSVAVNSALREVKDYTGGRLDRDSERRSLIEDMREQDQRDYGSQRDTRGSVKQRMYQEVIGFAKEEANNLNFTISALRQIIDMLSGLEGRKSLIYVSSGLAMSPGLGLMHEYAVLYHDNSILSRRSQFDSSADFRSLTTAANSQGVTLYTLDAEGLNVRDGIGADQQYGEDPTASSVGDNNYLASLRYMAERTGGLAIVNTNDPTSGLERISDDLFSFYSLGYSAAASGRDAVHTIKVKIPDHPDYDIRYREKYIEKSLETRIQDRVMTALLFDVDDNPMQLRIGTKPARPGTNDRWLKPLEISFPLRKLALTPIGDELVGNAVFFIGARDHEGRESAIQRQEHEVRIPAAEYESSARQRYAIEFNLLMIEGHHRIVVGMLDPLTRNASYFRESVRIP